MAAISGSYPAIYLSGFRPAEVLKGQVIRGIGAELVSQESGDNSICRFLILIISTFIVIRQMEFHAKLEAESGGKPVVVYSIRRNSTTGQIPGVQTICACRTKILNM